MRIYLIILFISSLVSGQGSDTLYILQTTDLHGTIYPYNYFKDEPAENGLAKIYTRVAQYRKTHENVVLLDGGDLLQGTPMVYYFNHHEKDKPNPMILTMNYMQYDAFAVGNHDIEQGLFVYNKAEREADFPWLSANSIMEDGQSYFKPYTIIERNGIKIGILGLTTPGIPMWLEPGLYPGINWTDMLATAKKYVTLLRPKVDILVGLFHAGLNAGYSAKQTEAAGLPNENASGLVAENLPQFDIILAGHSHRNIPKTTITQTDEPLQLNAGSRGNNLAVARLILTNKGGKWEVESKTGWLESMKAIQPSQGVLDLNRYYHHKTIKYIRTEIAQLEDGISSRNSRFADNPVIDLINQAQLDYTDADISFAASFNDNTDIAQGAVRIKDIYTIYPYENFLYMLQMTGRQIKDFLEYSACYFVLEKGEVAANASIPGYNYDMAEGISYKINLNNDAGQRIEAIKFDKTGEALDMNHTYKVAMNSYRASGGGGHLAAAGIEEPHILTKSNREMRTILIDYCKKIKRIKPAVNHNWELIY